MNRANQLAGVFAAAVWRLDAKGPPLRTQLYRQLRDAVTEGRVAPGAALPSTRELAQVLGVSRSTLVEALDQLRIEGYLETRQGAATRVATLNPAHLGSGDPSTRGSYQAARHGAAADKPSVRLDHWVQDDPPTPVTVRAFRPGLPDIRAFPAREWATHLARRARQPASHDLSYVGHTGVPSLREQIVRHVGESRHVIARPKQVIVLPSAQAAFDVAIRCSLKPGDPVWVEDPCYPGIRTLLRAHGAKVIAVPVDAGGMRPDRQRAKPRLIYLTPSHQYPTGTMLSLPRRLELLDIARRHGAAIIEDDYDSEFQIDGQPIASLQGLDRSGCVHYVGTFSKSLAPGLRVAYLIVPPRQVELAETIASVSGLGVPVHVQLAMADFMADGGLRRHIHRMRVEYGERLTRLHRTLLSAGFERIFPGSPAGGLQLCMALPPSASDRRVVQQLAIRGLHAQPPSTLSHSHAWTDRPGLLLGIGLVPTSEVEAQAKALCAAIRNAG
jgi:GntR family transcriptional regulator/MocR family aminotransferase